MRRLRGEKNADQFFMGKERYEGWDYVPLPEKDVPMMESAYDWQLEKDSSGGDLSRIGW